MICSSEPPEVALETAQAASFWISNSAVDKNRIKMGNISSLTTAWICAWLPAVIFERVQQASFRIARLGLSRSARRQRNAEKLMMIYRIESISIYDTLKWEIRTWVWISSPVTIFPTVRSAGVCTKLEGYINSSTTRRHTPASTTAWIFSFDPSERYESAQQASVNTSSSCVYSNWPSVGRAGATSENSGWGFPRQKLDSVQVAFRSIDNLDCSVSWCNNGCKAPHFKTISRQSTESPAIFPSAQTACSRTSSFWDISSWQKIGTAPKRMTTSVSSEVPEAIFVSAHAASNWRRGTSSRFKYSTNNGTTPVWMTSLMGGFRSGTYEWAQVAKALRTLRTNR